MFYILQALGEFRVDEKVSKPLELFEYLNQLFSDTAFIKRLIGMHCFTLFEDSEQFPTLFVYIFICAHN